MTSLFVSYSRKDMDCARRLTEAFKVQDFDFWIDWEGIPPTVDWWIEVERGIEQAGVFLFLVSPASLRSKVCRQEIDHALKNGKRLIPVVVRDVNAEEAPSVLSHLNWIFIRENDDFNAAFGKLITAIKTDYDWVKTHRELQVKALEWERNKHDKSFLLRGTELQFAEFQLRTNSSKDPHPTDLQQEYVLKSRQAANRQRRLLASFAIGVVIALAALGAFGWIQAGQAKTAQASAESNLAIAQTAQNDAITKQALADANAATAVAEANARATALVNEENARAIAQAEKNRAEEQAKIALSRQLAAQAQVLMDEQFDLALLLAIEASRDTTDGRFALSNMLLAEPYLIRIINSADYLGQGDSGFIEGLAFNPNGNQLAAKSYDLAGFWDFGAHITRKLTLEEYKKYQDDWESNQITWDHQEIPTRPLVINKNLFQMGTFSPSINQVAIAACRTMPSAGGAPGCSSLIYIFSEEFDRLITPLASCNPIKNVPDFKIELDGGLFRIRDFKSAISQSADFELYSVALSNVASNVGSELVGALYDSQTNRLTTAAAYGRHKFDLALIVWDLNEKKPIMELFKPPGGIYGNGKISFNNAGAALDVCLEGTGIRIDINPESWRAQACEMVGRNLTLPEWKQFIGDENPYRPTCPEWPEEN